MLTISDSVDISVPPSEVWTWLSELPAHYTEWHPAHRDCHVVRGSLWTPSAILEVQEDLHGRRHRFRFEVVSVTPGREVTYRAAPWLSGRFLVGPVNAHSSFTAELSFGIPGLGKVLDRPLAWLFRDRIAAVQQHQREEAANLKQLLEKAASAG